jgi:hypothetical protein
MMGREVIALYKTDMRTISVRDGWEFVPHGRLAWLQRFLWRRLVKMRAVGVHMRDEVQTVRLPCDADTILGKIMEAREGLFRAYREPSEVLIGPDTLAELLNAPELRGWNSPFTIDSQAAIGDRSGGRRMFNLPIHVEPTMEGVLVR